MAIDTQELRRKVNSTDILDHIDLHANIKPFLSEMIDRLEAAEKEIALKERVIDALGSELNAVANERDTLRTALTDLLNDLEERAKWNLEASQRVVACGNGVYMRAKAALEESK